MAKTRLAILASGSGSNAESIIQYFKGHSSIEVTLIISNRKKAFVLDRAEQHNIDWKYCPKGIFEDSESVVSVFQESEIDFIILAGFLLKIPKSLINQFPGRIINIHPSLLPKYGGKGMYGQHVHQAVFDNFEKESGMTVHLVNEEFDKGKILFQKKVVLSTLDTPNIIASKVLELEHAYFAPTIEDYILSFE